MRQGDTWPLQVNWYNPLPNVVEKPDLTKPIDITGYNATLQVSTDSSADTALLTLTSSPAAGLTVNGPAGQVSAHATPAQTLALPDGHCWWGMEVSNGTDKYTLAAGPLFVLRKAAA